VVPVAAALLCEQQQRCSKADALSHIAVQDTMIAKIILAAMLLASIMLSAQATNPIR
jgi:hypothetical protein